MLRRTNQDENHIENCSILLSNYVYFKYMSILFVIIIVILRHKLTNF